MFDGVNAGHERIQAVLLAGQYDAGDTADWWLAAVMIYEELSLLSRNSSCCRINLQGRCTKKKSSAAKMLTEVLNSPKTL